ncbi:MAG: NADH:ubiquinone reductase (Na(+)-transporting) subunit C [Tidjanibacter sp.]|nr:NADH:ubiquinone reductase (Na(+)-transporting) subunit C [Tidjanibacter sp.]
MSNKKFLGGKDSNAYIVFYSAVMVIIVAVLLAFTSLSLKEKQYNNELNEKKDAIVASLGLEKGSYDSVITEYVVDSNGESVRTLVNKKGEKISEGDEKWKEVIFEKLGNLAGAYEDNLLIVFENKTTGEIVFPITGKGLWDDIWGYVALEADLNTIKGVIFDHAGETPGLGAEIATPKYQAQFPGKTIYEGSQLVGISVVKGGAKEGDNHAVDAVTGGTKTSIGLENMIKDCLGCYDAFIMARTAVAFELVSTENAE